MNDEPNHVRLEGHRQVHRELTAHHLELIGRQLRGNARLFDDSEAYLAGVEDCLAAIERTLGLGRRRIDLRDTQDVSPRMI
ncbi:MAG: hypothetical protein KY437_09020 [Actinobacteria bacterium]|nr:hypothetical protein [Actinomycetota bacterium]